MKSICLFCLFFAGLQLSFAQQSLDSLRKQLDAATKEDTNRVKALGAIANYYGFVQFDSAFFYAKKVAALSEKLDFEDGRLLSYQNRFFAYNVTGNFPMAMEQALNYEKTYEHLRKEGKKSGGGSHYFLGFLYLEMADYSAAKAKLWETINVHKETGSPMPDVFFAYSQLGIVYDSLNRLDSALWYAQQGYDLGAKSRTFRKFYSLAIGALGSIHAALHHYKLAEDLFHYGIRQSRQFTNIYFEARNYYNLASLFEKENLRDSAAYYGGICLHLCMIRQTPARSVTIKLVRFSKTVMAIYGSERAIMDYTR